MSRSAHSIRQALLPVLALAALATMGCASSITSKFPHLDRRSVCLVVPGIEVDSTEYVFSDDNVPISNFHPEDVDRVAPTARTVFEYDPGADPSSVRYLPAPYDQLDCPALVSWWPAQEPEQSPLPDASLALSVYEPPSDAKPVPGPITKQLASCLRQNASPLGAISYTMNFNVFVKDNGQAVSAYVNQSTLGDRDTQACMLDVLRKTQWPELPAAASAVAAAHPLKTFLAQPAPVEPVPDSAPQSGIRRILPPIVEPPGAPGGNRVPVTFAIPLPVLVGLGVGVTITIWPRQTAPDWLDELNPVTRRPYTNPQEYDFVRRLPPEEITGRQMQEAIKNAKPVAPPAPQPPPVPAPAPQPEKPQRPPECPRNESFTPICTDNATGCTDKNGNVRCYSSRHYPCTGVHTHGKLRYQKIRRGVCVQVEDEAVRCEGPFTISGPCGSVSTVECRDGGPEISGIFVQK